MKCHRAKITFFTALAVIVGVMVFIPGKALAHKVMVFGYVEDGKVKTISKFSGGKKVMGGKITVFDVDGKQLLQGVTDDNGEFSFDIPSKKGLKIELEAAMGHKNISEIPADQLGVPDAAPSVGEKADETAGSSSSEVTTTEEIPAASDGQDADLEARIEKVLDRKVMPILQMMAEKEDKPGFKDIVGGIGYIVGLMGLFLYMKSRKEK
jgi:nickel transport protein